MERKRKNTTGTNQQRQKDTSGKRGHVKPVRPCTGLTTRFVNSKTWLLCGTTVILGGSDAADARIFTKESDYGFRDYSPAHARFITEDPIRDGENWFAYVGNNPVNWVDPDGREQVYFIYTYKNTEYDQKKMKEVKDNRAIF